MTKPIERLSIVSEQKEEGAALGPDPDDIASLRIPVNYAEDAGDIQLLTNVQVRTPHKQWWIRVHPDAAYRARYGLIKHHKDKEFYLVRPDILPELRDEVAIYALYLAVNRYGLPFLWPISVPSDDDRRSNDWVISAHNGAKVAMEQWARIMSNMHLGAYVINATKEDLGEPMWPKDKMFDDLVKIAFVSTGRLIKTLDHPVIKDLQGRK